MKKYKLGSMLMACILLLSLSACAPEEETAQSKLIGGWYYAPNTARFVPGALLNPSDQKPTIDTATLLSTVNSLFDETSITYTKIRKGGLAKVFEDTQFEDSTSLAALLNGLDGSIVKEYTYEEKAGKVAMVVGDTTYTFTIVSIEDHIVSTHNFPNLTIAIPLADLTKWMTGILGDKVPNLSETPIFSRISQIVADAGVYDNPTITLVFNSGVEL